MESNKGNELRQEYILRINTVQDYIEKNINKVFSLEELSAISGFSKYHFHRIFGSIVNETLYNYINRLKLEKAASYLLHAPHKTITQIAMDFGFADSAMFARSFKKHYGVSATEYRTTYSKNIQTKSKIRKAKKVLPTYNDDDITNKLRRSKMEIECKVDIVNIEEMTVVYLRHLGTYAEFGEKFHDMISRLAAWGFAQGVMIEGTTKLLTIYHDNPEITQDDRRRTSVCISVPKDTKVNGEFGKMAVPEGKYAIGHFVIDDDAAARQHANAWEYLYGQWLPQSGYQPGDGPNFEIYLNDPSTHPEKKRFIDIYLPVKPL